MNNDSGAAFAQLFICLLFYVPSALLIGFMAARKNRNPWAWGLIGGLFCLPGLLVLAFMSYVCPICKRDLTNDQWSKRTCPECGDVSEALVIKESKRAPMPESWRDVHSGMTRAEIHGLIGPPPKQDGRTESWTVKAGSTTGWHLDVKYGEDGRAIGVGRHVSTRQLSELKFIAKPPEGPNREYATFDRLKHDFLNGHVTLEWVARRQVEVDYRPISEVISLYSAATLHHGKRHWTRLADKVIIGLLLLGAIILIVGVIFALS